jgi:endonuclease/exonuclease/phosphatase family metal-dependent hydrolase
LAQPRPCFDDAGVCVSVFASSIFSFSPPQEPAVFGGDLNEDYHPVRILNEECAFVDVFETLDLVPPITHPVRPSDPREEMKPSRTLDWILCSLPTQCRVIAAFAKTVRGGRVPPISDHLPVVAVLEIA